MLYRPTFLQRKNYEVIWGDGAETRQFNDRFGDVDSGGRMHKDIQKYLDWMEPRLKEIYRVLKPTGSFYLHCDDHASHYLKMYCDNIFGYNKFRNEIIWHYGQRMMHIKTGFNRKHDKILFYTKSDKYYFKLPVLPYTHDDILKFGHIGKDEIGEYTTYADGKGGRYKKYTSDIMKEGKPMTDVWNDIGILVSTAKERFGYPTQKPEALLERIIQASSNEGDIVLDAFCGCGTALAVAKRLKRQYIGIDISPTACRLVAWRLNGYDKIQGKEWNEEAYKEFNAAPYVEGLALTPDEIAGLSGFEFQNWINRELGANPGKAGADGGIDGMLNGVPIQVKKYKAGRNDLDTFSGSMLRNKAMEGIFIALDFAATFHQEVRRLDKENGIKINAWSFQDILDGKQKEWKRKKELV